VQILEVSAFVRSQPSATEVPSCRSCSAERWLSLVRAHSKNGGRLLHSTSGAINLCKTNRDLDAQSGIDGSEMRPGGAWE
jgi:hypothetical protein